MPKLKEWRGWFCRICYCRRPNEAFSGKGRQIHICKRCREKPKNEIQEIIGMDELHGIFEQKNISFKNLKRLKELTSSANPRIKSLAEVILQIGQAHPHRRRRLGFIKFNHSDLWTRMIDEKIIFPDEFCERDPDLDEYDDEYLDFESLCEYAENENFVESELDNEKIEENECPF